MEAIRIHRTVKREGEIRITGLPCHKGQDIEMILLLGEAGMPEKTTLTAAALHRSELAGLWKGRDIEDSAVYARGLREKTQLRRR